VTCGPPWPTRPMWGGPPAVTLAQPAADQAHPPRSRLTARAGFPTSGADLSSRRRMPARGGSARPCLKPAWRRPCGRSPRPSWPTSVLRPPATAAPRPSDFQPWGSGRSGRGVTQEPLSISTAKALAGLVPLPRVLSMALFAPAGRLFGHPRCVAARWGSAESGIRMCLFSRECDCASRAAPIRASISTPTYSRPGSQRRGGAWNGRLAGPFRLRSALDAPVPCRWPTDSQPRATVAARQPRLNLRGGGNYLS